MLDLTRDLDEHIEGFQTSWKVHHTVYMSQHHPFGEDEATSVINLSTAKTMLHYKQAAPDLRL